ncbi:hypothetical protein BST23_04005 [Mycolicibacterium elephantis]|uniref:Secreted protein n=1 Tax=Mycolicibacterium elephantis TaxID=81858 RepID=A0A1X0D767_9MYCO|nr:hypothetical protein [Mycolicibacterium elephantis]ORA68255.1 hypothetical protein BST23_04005 [Mycolicibacterium elephantis]
MDHRSVTVAATAIAIGTACIAPPAGAADEVAINGTYAAFSDGRWAKTNDSRHDEKSVHQTWTITSTCTTYQDCTGRVVSDHGWSGDLVYLSGRWKVSHIIENWEPCFDGTAYPGTQTFTFWVGYPAVHGQYVGWDRTEGPSGACGFNKVLDIEMPFTLTRVD